MAKKQNIYKSITVKCIQFLIIMNLMSCEQSKYQVHGAFTNWNNLIRMPASTNIALTKFKEFQDPKQILLYCKMNSIKEKMCFKDHISKDFIKFKNKNPEMSPQEYASLKEYFSYENVKQNFDNIKKELLEKTQKDLHNIAKKRKQFCDKNSKNQLKKCLTHFLEKDTFAVLNKLQSEFKMNGQEYLYLKEKLQSKLKNDLYTKTF